MSVTQRRQHSTATASAGETGALGQRLGQVLVAGDVILLEGELGSGKTCLTQGIARGLGIEETVSSPTFVLLGEYDGRLHLHHADLYRLVTGEEVAELELGRSTERGVLVVEWPERGIEALPSQHLLIRLAHAGGDRRALQLEAHGPRAEAILRALEATWS